MKREFGFLPATTTTGKPLFLKPRQGMLLRYSDGRTGHNNVVASILGVYPLSMVVQFSDRADTTTIKFSDSAWMDFLTID